MMDSVNVVESYLSWLRDNTLVSMNENNAGYTEIATPFLNHLRDGISIFAKHDKRTDTYTLSDGGSTIGELLLAGVELNTQKRKEAFDRILRRYGVSKDTENQIIAQATKQTLPAKKHNLLQAILASSELVHLAKASVASLFWEDVALFLTSNEIRFVEDVKFTGTTGFDHQFDCVIPKSVKAPERIIKALYRPDKSRVENLLFSWTDTKEVRKQESRLIVFLDDTDKIERRLIEPFEKYDALPILWSQRQEALNINILAA